MEYANMASKWQCLLCVSLAVSAECFAAPQQPAASSATTPDNSKEPYILQSSQTKVSFESDGTLTSQSTDRVKLQSEAGLQHFGLLTFQYLGGQEIQINYVRVRKPDGQVIPTPAEDIQDMASDVARTAPMYTDLREKHVPVKRLGVGDALEYETTTRVIKPLVPGQFWYEYHFSKDAVILDEQLEVQITSTLENSA